MSTTINEDLKNSSASLESSSAVEVFTPQNQPAAGSPPNSPTAATNNINDEQKQNENAVVAPTPVIPPPPANSESSIQNTPAASFAEENFQPAATTTNNQNNQNAEKPESAASSSSNNNTVATAEPEPKKPLPVKTEETIPTPSNNDNQNTNNNNNNNNSLREKSRSPPSNKVDYPYGVPVANHHHHLHLNNSSSVSPPSSNTSPARNNNNNNQNEQQHQNTNEPVGRNHHHHNESYSSPQNYHHHHSVTSTSYRDASPSISSTQGQSAVPPMTIPYDLQRKVPPSLHLPHCHPHHLEKSQLYPSLLLNDDFWKDALIELKTHDIPSGGQLSFTQDDVNRWHDQRVCPVGFDRREWDLLVRHFDLADRPNGVFDSISFKDLLAEIGAPCTIAMATHIIMNLRCLESGRIRCETAVFALRAIQRVIARRVVAEDLAKQVHEKRILFQIQHQHNNSNHNNQQQVENNNNNNTQNNQQQQSLPSLNLNSIQQHQQRQASNSRASSTPRNATTTPRGNQNNNNSHNNNNETGNNDNNNLQFMVHPGIHRPVVTPIQSPPPKIEESQQQQLEKSTKTPRSARAESTTTASHHEQSQNNNNNNNKRTNGMSTPRAPSPSNNNNGVLGLPFHGAPRLGERAETPRDDRTLITEDVSGVMSKSPHRTTLKWAALQKHREKQRQEQETKQQKMEELEDARREKFGMKPRARSTSRGASERNTNNNDASSSSSVLRGGRASSVATNTTFNGTTITNNSPSSNSSANRNNNNNNAGRSTPHQIHTSLPTGEAHAVLMRARQQRADGVDNFLNSKARNGLISEKPSVEYGAVLSADKTQMLWNSNQISPVVTVHRTPKQGPPTPSKGVYQNKTTNQDFFASSSNSGILNSPVGHPNVVLSPNSARAKHWR